MASLRGIVVLLILGAVSAKLGLDLREELQPPAGIPAVAKTAPAAGAAQPGQAAAIADVPPYDPPPIERFAAAIDRPLFRPDRRPAQDIPSVTVASADQALTATLSGILLAESGSVALLTAVGEATPVRVSQGDTYLGWRLATINPDNVVFEKDGEQVTLELIYKAATEPADGAGRRSGQKP